MRDGGGAVVHVGVALIRDIGGDGVRADDHGHFARAEHILQVVAVLGGRVGVGVALVVQADGEFERFDVLGAVELEVALRVNEAAVVAPDVIGERGLAFVGGHVDAPGIHVAAVEVDDRLAGVLEIGPGFGHFNADFVEDIGVVVQRAGGGQIRHGPDGIVNDGFRDEGREEIVVQLFRAIILHGQQQLVGRNVLGERVDIEDVGSVVIADARADNGVHVVPGDDFQVQLDARIFGFKLLNEAGAVHAGSKEPVVRVRAVLADDDVQRDILGGGHAGAGKDHHGGQKQSEQFLHVRILLLVCAKCVLTLIIQKNCKYASDILTFSPRAPFFPLRGQQKSPGESRGNKSVIRRRGSSSALLW